MSRVEMILWTLKWDLRPRVLRGECRKMRSDVTELIMAALVGLACLIVIPIRILIWPWDYIIRDIIACIQRQNEVRELIESIEREKNK